MRVSKRLWRARRSERETKLTFFTPVQDFNQFIPELLDIKGELGGKSSLEVQRQTSKKNPNVGALASASLEASPRSDLEVNDESVSPTTERPWVWKNMFHVPHLWK